MAASLFDRIVAVFSPAAAAARSARARREYVAASKGRRDDWNPRARSANAEIERSLPVIRKRMRDLVRNNPHAAKAVSTLVTHIVGDGILPRSDNNRVNALWEAWQKECHAKKKLNFAGIQTLACREFLEAGEVLIRLRWRKMKDSKTLPICLQVIEAECLDIQKNGKNGSNQIRQGVEVDEFECPVAYWLFPHHPGGNQLLGMPASIRIPADEIIHIYEFQRDQDRGVPWGTPAMIRARDLNIYEDAELERKKVSACYVGVLVGGDESDFSIGLPTVKDGETPTGPGVYDGEENLVERFEPGMFAIARGGRDVRFNTPGSDQGYEPYKRASLQDIAAGFRVPYELISGDLSHVSYISGRLGMQEFYRLCSQVQWQIFVPMLCERVWDWFIDAAHLTGKLPSVEGVPEWSPPKMPDVDPLKSAQADMIEVRAGFKAWDDAVHERGWNPSDQRKKIAEHNAALDKDDITLDSDPRKVAKSGAFQVNDTGADKTDGESASGKAGGK